jgi:hypothetical protein
MARLPRVDGVEGVKMPSIPLWSVALPLGCYLTLLGLVHLRRRPLAVSGAVDAVCLAAGLSGCVAAGLSGLAFAGPPLWGWNAMGGGWAVLGAVAVLLLALAILISRPRLVVYNATVEQLRPAVAEVVLALDPSARWAGETVAMPSRGLQVHIDGGSAMRNVTLVALGKRPSPEGWSEFTRRLRGSVGLLRVSSSPWSGLFLLGGIMALAAATWSGLGGL